MGDKVENTIDKKEVDETPIEAVIAESASADSSDNKKAATEKSSHAGTYFIALFLLIAAIVGGLTLTGQLQPLYVSLTNTVREATAVLPQNETIELKEGRSIQSDSGAQVRPMKPAIHTELQADINVESNDLQIVPDGLHISPDPRQAVVPSGHIIASQPLSSELPQVNTDSLKDLLLSLDTLRNALGRMEESQQLLQQSLIEQQQMNLQVRLRWISDSDSRLPQIQLAWEEISLLPGLNEQQRQQAVAMHALARKNVQGLHQWKGSLHKWAEALTTPLHENILPKPEHPWLAWIVGQFELHQAPSQEAQTLMDLRGRLLDSARMLTLQSWPDQRAWQRLHAELLLQIKAMQSSDEKAAIETGLPVDFAGIKNDISILRQTAQEWISDVQQQGGML